MGNVSLISGSELCSVCGREIPEDSSVCVICGNTEPKDMVAVVRCKKCKNKMQGIEYRGNVYCKLHKLWVTKNAFCSYGVRRKNDE